jgi:hypothetical protein
MANEKQETITFKVDAAFLEAMKGIENRSGFIRSAVLAALDSVCPLCRGTGVLNPRQKEHWKAFSKDHTLTECGDCHEMHIVCEKSGERKGGKKKND